MLNLMKLELKKIEIRLVLQRRRYCKSMYSRFYMLDRIRRKKTPAAGGDD